MSSTSVVLSLCINLSLQTERSIGGMKGREGTERSYWPKEMLKIKPSALTA